jgi:hypothetical protein
MSNTTRKSILLYTLLLLALAACVRQPANPAQPSALQPVEEQATAETPDLPSITDIALDREKLPRYESLEITVNLEAQYANPYDARQIRLDGVFTAPDGLQMSVPGFWDSQGAWKMRFTPSQAGEWTYSLTIQDARGISSPAQGTFSVAESDLRGWLQPGRDVDPEYSPRYLVYHDGTPFYGYGYCEALNILIDGFNAERGVGLFNNMVEAGENFVVWWPLYSMSPINSSYSNYSASNMNLIDVIVRDAEKKGVFLVFTVWDHPQLRAANHPWGTGNWGNNNGFRNLGDLPSFFIDPEAWAWQENFYRYIIARWSYSPAIGMWQTVSEINGTEAFDLTDSWHEKVNNYFIENDPYRHPTTASMSGDVNWVAGYDVMDAPQVHLYEFDGGAVQAAEVLAYWTQLMWDEQEKPNWVGEFGVPGTAEYPELFHNSIWAALGSGAAMTPAEWNSGGSWGRPTPEMKADMARFIQFVEPIALARLNPQRIGLAFSDEQVRGWGIAGVDGGLFWAQDFSMQGRPIQEVRADETVRSGVQVEITGLAGGEYTITPYDTWQGVYLEPIRVACEDGQACLVSLPDFQKDMAFRIER